MEAALAEHRYRLAQGRAGPRRRPCAAILHPVPLRLLRWPGHASFVMQCRLAAETDLALGAARRVQELARAAAQRQVV